MTIAILILTLLVLAGIAGTIRLVADGGRGCAPRSHRGEEANRGAFPAF